MARSAKKGPYVDHNIAERVAKGNSGTPIKTWARASEISPEMVGFTFLVHTGKDFMEIKISEEMVGHRLGEFAPTRKFTRHGGKMQKELEKKTTAAPAAAPAAAPKKK